MVSDITNGPRATIRQRMQTLFPTPSADDQDSDLKHGLNMDPMFIDADSDSTNSLHDLDSEKCSEYSLSDDALETGNMPNLNASLASTTTNRSNLTAIPKVGVVHVSLNRDTASWGSRNRTWTGTSFGSVAGRTNGDTQSFDSTVTDFDFLTCPGAQAERNVEYQAALHKFQAGGSEGARPFLGVTVPTAPLGAYGIGANATPPFGLTGPSAWPGCVGNATPPNPTPISNCAGMQTKLAQLDAFATQLMAQAMQAKAEVLRMQHEPAAPMLSSCAMGQSANLMVAAQGPGQTACSPTPHTEVPDVHASTLADTRESERTTIMLRNLPNDYTRAMVVELLCEHGFACSYDFFYMPMDSHRKCGLGYAFVNMVKPSDAERAFVVMQGFSNWKVIGSSKVLQVAWGNPLQGLAPHVDRYRNCPVMHPDVPDEFKPMLFQKGVRINFPPPTRKLRAPRKNGIGRGTNADETVLE